MKVTISKVVTPVTRVFREEKVCSELTKREHVADIFLDPWVRDDDYAMKQFFRDLTLKIGKVLDENTPDIQVKADVMYTINGVGHFHQEGVSYTSEVKNYHLLDQACYGAVVSRYAAGARVDLGQHYKGSGLSKAQNRINHSKRYRSKAWTHCTRID